MSTEPKQNDRVRAVLLSVVVVLSVLGGVTAIAGQTVADGSLSDGVDDTDDDTDDAVDDTTDELDSDTTDDGTLSTDDEDLTNTTDDVTDADDDLTDDGLELSDDGDVVESDTGDSGTDDDPTAATESDVGATPAAAGTVDPISLLDDLSGALYSPGIVEALPTGTLGVLRLDDGVLASESSASSADGSSSGTDGGADPASVGITAGAAGQAPVATVGEGPATLNFTESEPGAFPDNGTARLTLEAGDGVAFDTDATSASATADGGNVSVASVGEETVTVQVSSTDENATTTLHLDGVRFESGSNASTVDATWSYGEESAATTVRPEYLAATGFGDDVPRGADGAGGGAFVYVEAPDDTRTEGFVAATDEVGIRIPDEHQADLSFDTSAELEVYTERGDCGLPVLSDPIEETHWVEENVILVELSCEIGQEEYLRVEGVGFNVSGADAAAPAEFASQLEVDYQPVNMTDQPTIDGGDPVEAHAPVVSAGSTTVETNVTNTTGDDAVTVSLEDDVGGLLGDGTRITVALQDSGVTFNESQTFDAIAVSGDTPGPTVVSANATAVVLEVDGPTQAGDEFRLQRAGGGNITFDVAPDASDAAIEVTTTPGAEDVTQVTGTVVGVDQQTCHSVLEAVAGEDDRIDNPELAGAVDRWRLGEDVPGTCGKTISNPQMAHIKDLWRSGGTVDNS